jgi:hypothetical protein
MTIQTHGWLSRGRSSRLSEGLGGAGAGAGGVVTVVLGESLVPIETGAFVPAELGVPGVLEPLGVPGALGEFGVLGGLSGNLKFLFSGLDLEPFELCYRRRLQIFRVPGFSLSRTQTYQKPSGLRMSQTEPTSNNSLCWLLFDFPFTATLNGFAHLPDVPTHTFPTI